MTLTILHIDASVGGNAAKTRAAVAEVVARRGADDVIYRDLAADPLPHIDGTWADARLVPENDRTPTQKSSLALSDTLIAELQAADEIVIGLPVYNFGMPASLKAWVDLVARPGVTFRYTENGPEGLLKGKRATIAVASGGTPIGSDWDFATTHLRHVLGFIGITDVVITDANAATAAAAA